MIPALVYKKAIGKRKEAPPSPLSIYKALKEQQISWVRLTAKLSSSFLYANATKSLKSIAKQFPFFQEHFSQARSTNVYAMIDPSTTQNYQEAIKSKDKDLVRQHIEYKLDSSAPNIEEVLKTFEAVLADCPAKNYKYTFALSFEELDFGPHTLSKLPASFTEALKEEIAGASPLMREAFQGISTSRVHFYESGVQLLMQTNCLLEETESTSDLNQLKIPPKFSALVGSLHEYKPKDVKRICVNSPEEMAKKKEAATQKLAERTALSPEEIKEQFENHYAKLTLDQQMELERGLHQYVFNQPASMAVPDSTAGDDAKRYFLAMLQAHIGIANRQQQKYPDTELQKLRLAAAKAMRTDSFKSFDSLETSDPVQNKLEAYQAELTGKLKAAKEAASNAMRKLAGERQLPHYLEDYHYQLAPRETGPQIDTYVPFHLIWVPEESDVPPSLKALGYDRERVKSVMEKAAGLYPNASRQKIQIDGIDCFAIHADREKFDRKKILNNAFKPLGYKPVPQGVGSVGSYQFLKQISPEESLLLTFDFGSWRQTIQGTFSYRGTQGEGVRGRNMSLPFFYWSVTYPHGGMRDMAITSELLFTMAFANIAHLAQMLEQEHVPLFREALKEASLA